jgi:hypothetical protein
LLCALALLGMQIFGGVAGYLCRCGGQETVTLTDHCHGPHSESCHDPHSERGRVESDVDDDADSADSADREDHQPVRKDIPLVQSSKLLAPLLLQVIVEILPNVSFPRVLREDSSLKSALAKGFRPLPQALALRKTVALLV